MTATVETSPGPFQGAALGRAEAADRLVSQREAAFALGLDEERFQRRRAALEEQGFPPPVFGAGRKGRWDPVAIRAWIEMRRPSAIRAFLAAPVPVGTPAPVADNGNHAADVTTQPEGSPT